MAGRVGDVAIDEHDLISDEELTALALAADPDLPFDDDAEPFDARLGMGAGDGLLPDWYMPSPSPSRRRRDAVIALVVIASLVLVNAYGLCVTYGHLEIPL